MRNGLLALIFLAVIVPGKPNQAGNGKNKGSQSKPQTTLTLINNESPETHSEKAGENAPHWYTHLKRPEWWLVIAAFVTLLVIAWQSVETRRAAEATQRSAAIMEQQTASTEKAAIATQAAAEATNKSVELQRVAMQQWIDTDDWKAGPGFIQPTATEAFLPVSFDVVNTTKYKMLLDRVDIWIDREEACTVWFRKQLLTPDGGHATVGFQRKLEGLKLETYRKGLLRFEIGGVVSYVDAFGEAQEQKFGFHCACSMTTHADFDPIAFYPPDERELEAQKKRKARAEQQSPN